MSFTDTNTDIDTPAGVLVVPGNPDLGDVDFLTVPDDSSPTWAARRAAGHPDPIGVLEPFGCTRWDESVAGTFAVLRTPVGDYLAVKGITLGGEDTEDPRQVLEWYTKTPASLSMTEAVAWFERVTHALKTLHDAGWVIEDNGGPMLRAINPTARTVPVN